MLNSKKAFTLVELIVVITILAVLGTIAFISLQGYSANARDSKRVQNVTSLLSKITIEVGKGSSLSKLISSGSGSNASSTTYNATINGSSTGVINQGAVNFLAIRENKESFMDLDSSQDYPFAYAEGGTGTGAYKFIQMATVSESENTAVVKGNYYKMQSGDTSGLISNGTDIYVDGGVALPYSI